MDGTQVSDIEKKVDYPKFKKGVKFTSKNEAEETPVVKDDIKASDLLTKFIIEETEAIKSYTEILDSKVLSPEDIEQIKEFISDEKHHLKTLTSMLQHYDGIEPAED